MSRRIDFAVSARHDLADLLADSAERFGLKARRRYEALIAQALKDVAADPFRPGSAARPELGEGARSFHLRLSRDRLPKDQGRVDRPRHFLIYDVPDAASLTILRVLYDSMDLESQMSGLRR